MTSDSTSGEPSPHLSSPSLEIDERGVGWLVFDDPTRRVNLLSEEVMGRLAELLGRAEAQVQDGRLRALVLWSGKRDTFIAGAEVDAIEAIEDPQDGAEKSRLGQEIFGRLEHLPVPTVAAIDGTCLGGGLEMSLACRYRVASDSEKTRLGFPEVQLGILPAWGGTTRLPRLIGLQSALDLLLTGKRLDPERARRKGLVEDVVPAEGFREEVESFVQARLEGGPVATGRSRGLLTRILEDTAPGRRIVLRQARKRVLSRTGGHYPAPLAILDVLQRSLGASLEKAFELEAQAAGDLIVSEVSKNLIHVFHLREAARKAPDRDQARNVGVLGVLGAGTMGGGIAQLAAYNDLRVRMKDIDHDAVADGLSHARRLFDKAVEKHKLGRREADRKQELIAGGVSYDGFGRADLVVEAVVERMEVKRTVLGEVEERVPEACVLTTNTSSLSVDRMAEPLKRPGNFGGMHFFNPVHKMPLVEVVRGARTSEATVATIRKLALDLGKTPVVVKDGPGFLVNRILGPYLNEAGWLLADGAAIEAVDEAATEFGMPMGPLRLVDEVGIDVARHAGETLYEAFGERLKPAPPLVAVGESDRLGKKGGLGFYRYESGREKGVDPDVYRLLGSAVPRERRELERRDTRARLVVAMVNEAARALSDGIVESAGELDLAMIMGTGFPPFRGGLLRYVDRLHPRTVLERSRELARTVGPRFEPPELLKRLAEEDRGFYAEFPG